MKTITQLPDQGFVTLSDILVGECFVVGGLPFMRIVPVKNLVRSTMVHEVLTRGDCFVLNLQSGQFTVMKYSCVVIRVDSSFTYSISAEQ